MTETAQGSSGHCCCWRLEVFFDGFSKAKPTSLALALALAFGRPNLSRCGQTKCRVCIQVRATSGKFLSSSEGRTGYAIIYNIARCVFSNLLSPKSSLDVKLLSTRTAPVASWPLSVLGAYVACARRFLLTTRSGGSRSAS